MKTQTAEGIVKASEKYALESFIPLRNSDGEILRIPPKQTVPCGFAKHKKIAMKHFQSGANWYKNDHTATQIEALRERLQNEFSDNGTKMTIDLTINNFLKEINDGKI
jgi:hypothetical protein